MTVAVDMAGGVNKATNTTEQSLISPHAIHTHTQYTHTHTHTHTIPFLVFDYGMDLECRMTTEDSNTLDNTMRPVQRSSQRGCTYRYSWTGKTLPRG